MNRKLIFILVAFVFIISVVALFTYFRRTNAPTLNFTGRPIIQSEVSGVRPDWQDDTTLRKIFSDINQLAIQRIPKYLQPQLKKINNVEVLIVRRELTLLQSYGATTSGTLLSAGDWNFNEAESKLTIFIYNRQLNEDRSSISNLTNAQITKQVILLYMLALPLPPEAATTDIRDPKPWSIDQEYAALESKYFFSGGNTEDKSIGRYPIRIELE